MKFKTVAEIGGYTGMVAIQGATIPVTMDIIINDSSAMPPISMVVLVWFGLGLFFVRAVAQKDKLYLTSNGVGFILQSVLLSLIAI